VVRVLSASPASLEAAAALLAAGEVVAVPTDTVYGLAAAIGDEPAIHRLFSAKHRPTSLPIAVLCATTADVRGLVTAWPTSAARLARRYWPGPLTLVVDAAPALATRLGAAHGVGVRIPDDTCCRALLGLTGPLAVTSANLHGHRPATTAAAASALGDPIAAVLDDGVREGEVSTVVDLTTGSPVVVRDGAIRAADVLAAISAA
jgi:L-threonylcarbamoyladenylate synthase